ncbi:MAG: RNA polymerase sigma factor [Rikenellaceae bacterium]
MKIAEKSSNAEDLLILVQIRLFGDTSAFGALVRKYQSPLRRYLYNLTSGNGSLADDLSQETFIKAFTSIKGFKGIGSFRGWLFRIAYCQFIDTHRTFRYDADIAEINIAYKNVGQKLEVLSQTLAVLSEVERNLIILNCIEECSHSEIAKITALPLGTVKTHLARAKEKLKIYLAKDGKDF